jgi:GT2 family glycosyltransferase
MNIFVVIPNWNGAEWLAESLESIEKQSYSSSVIVVDNASADNSAEIVKSQFPNVILLKNDSNLGFAGGVNTGIRYALENDADAVALFNNDAVAEKDWLSNLVKGLDDEKVGIVTGKLLHLDGKHIDSTGDIYSRYGIAFPRGRNQEDIGQYDTSEEVFGASGGASLYKADMLRELGLFDEKFFAYYEDVDISFRAQLAGWKVRYEPKAIAYHRIGATSSKLGSFTRYHSVKNLFILYTKNMPGWLYWKYLPLFTYTMLRMCATSLLRGGIWAYLKGFGYFIFHLPAVLKDRHQIQKSRKATTKHINSILYKNRPPKIPKL